MGLGQRQEYPSVAAGPMPKASYAVSSAGSYGWAPLPQKASSRVLGEGTFATLVAPTTPAAALTVVASFAMICVPPLPFSPVLP